MFAGRNMMFASAAFSPLSLSPALWLDASDANTLYDATTGGSLVAADGAIARWEDKSGNARHATQATLANRPLRKTAVQNGKDIARFDGANDTMTHGLSGSLTACSIFAVTKKISEQSGYRGIVAVGLNYPSPNGSMLLSRAPGTWGTYVVDGAEYGRASTTSAGISAFRMLCMIDDFSSGGRFYMDGSTNGTWTGNTLGQIAHIGGQPAQNTHSDISEILVFPTALSDSDRQSVEAYLNAKWAIY